MTSIPIFFNATCEAFFFTSCLNINCGQGDPSTVSLTSCCRGIPSPSLILCFCLSQTLAFLLPASSAARSPKIILQQHLSISPRLDLDFGLAALPHHNPWTPGSKCPFIPDAHLSGCQVLTWPITSFTFMFTFYPPVFHCVLRFLY